MSTPNSSQMEKQGFELLERGGVLYKLFDDSENIIVDVVDPNMGVMVFHHRHHRKIGYVNLNGEPVENGDLRWTDMEHGQNVLCALRFPFFAFDITGTHLGAKGSMTLFRVIHLLENRIISDHEMPEHCTALEFDHTMHVWTTDTEGYVNMHTLEPPTVYRQKLPLTERGEVNQVVSLSSLPENATDDASPSIVALTQSSVFLVSKDSPPLSTPLPDVIQEKPPDIAVDVAGAYPASKSGSHESTVIPIPSLDEVDYVWQVRCLPSAMVILLQNSVLVKSRLGTDKSEWLHIANLPCTMDAVEVDPTKGTLALSHINGDIFIIHPRTPERQPSVLTPKSDIVIGRKANANSHMLCVLKNGFIVAARPEGMLDGTKL